MDDASLPADRGSTVDRFALPWVALCLLALNLGGCGALNPAFVAVLDPGGTSSSLPNSPGHVAIKFINNAEVSDRLITYLETSGANIVDLTEAERRVLKPRFRFNLIVTYADGTTQPFQIRSGSVDELLGSECPGIGLSRLSLDEILVVCDVARVELDPAAPVSVFIPVPITVWDDVVVSGGGGIEWVTWEPTDTEPCGWHGLEVDDTDDVADPLLRNIDRRRMPAPVNSPLCGSVITIEVRGQLTVPFFSRYSDSPSYDRGARRVEAGIGGHYEFEVMVH